jgi:hypothetical protein
VVWCRLSGVRWASRPLVVLGWVSVGRARRALVPPSPSSGHPGVVASTFRWSALSVCGAGCGSPPERKKERKKERKGLGAPAGPRIRRVGPSAKFAPLGPWRKARHLSDVCRAGVFRPVRSGRAASGPRAVWAGWHRPSVRTGSVSSAGGSVAAAAIVCCFCFFGRALLLLVLRVCVRWVWCRCRCHLLLQRRRSGLRVVSVGVSVGGLCSVGRWVFGCCCCLLLFPLHRSCSAWSVCRCRGWAFSLFSAVGGSGAVVAAI